MWYKFYIIVEVQITKYYKNYEKSHIEKKSFHVSPKTVKVLLGS